MTRDFRIMKLIPIALTFYLLLVGSGCGFLKKTQQSFPEDGRYKNISPGQKMVFAQFEDTLIRLYTLEKQNGELKVVKNQMQSFSFPETLASPSSLKLIKPSFDIDIITIPFKFRPPTRGFPDQLNTNFCGALFAGLRNDFFEFTYKKNIFNEYNRLIKHHGFGFGIFSGIGSTAMNPWVTLNRIDIEYDGFVLTTGLQTAVAYNNFTFGLAVGVDNLIDKNRSIWIYQNKAWIGLAVGLNLN